IDDSVEKIVPRLLKKHPNLIVIHVFGRLNEKSLHSRYQNLDDPLKKRLMLKTFLPDIYNYAAAADIIITRAGATSLAGFGILGKACIVIPARHLVDGHQIENALALEKKSAVALITEDRAGEELEKQVEYLLQHSAERTQLGERLQEATPSDAAERLANIIITEATRV
ncbi:MAG: glycosyltransferase, partial [Patescibacteria group bacterium]